MMDHAKARRLLGLGLLSVVVLVAVDAALEAALAQGNPFGAGPAPARAPAPDGIIGWVLAKQAEFYRSLSGMIRAAKQDGTAVFGLLGLSFAYGVFHAAGPGHGKAVISSYLVANEETWRRGVVLSFASALLQALVAVLLVGIAAALLKMTSQKICAADYFIEIASYSLIVAVGARLLWVKGRGLLAALQSLRRPLTQVGAAVTPTRDDHDHDHKHAGHHHHHHHDHDHDHDHASAWGHAHGPEPEDLAGPGGWRRGLAAIAAVGVRPCSGAIVVLVFALAQGLFWVGALATFVMGIGTAITVAVIATMAVVARGMAKRLASSRAGAGLVAMRGLEVAASLLILAFGLILLAGYMVNERIMFC
jgi:ABC-type nickel/cobalt efflux system permease component RcnA